MILARSPLRISLGGGGTDLPSYYAKHGGFVLAAAIDKYIYTSVTKPFFPGIRLKYSSIESVSDVDDVKHPIIREALKVLRVDLSRIEITTLAQIPSGTGLGSSGSFTVSLLHALSAYYRLDYAPMDLAELACEIEINKLKEPIGKQDQYMSALGGVRYICFHPDGSIETKILSLSPKTIFQLEDNLLLFFTNMTRSASAILEEQDKKSKAQNLEMTENLHFVKDLGFQIQDALVNGDLEFFAQLMNEHWIFKKRRSGMMTNSYVDFVYEIAMRNGALGGKLVGAGGGGFLMFYTNDPEKLRGALTAQGLEEVRFKFDFEGTKIILPG